MGIRRAADEDIIAIFRTTNIVHLSPPYTEIIPNSKWDEYQMKFQDTPENLAKYKTKIKRYITQSNRQVFVYEDDGEVVGFHLIATEDNIVYLRGIFVHPLHRGRGIGMTLFKEPLKMVQSSQVVKLKVLKKNTRALEMYKKYGFVEIDEEVADFYGAKQTVMQLG